MAKILIVEDRPTDRKLLRARLEAEGHAVIDASNGLEALQLLERGQADAVISDILMPNMDGFRLCQEIRKSQNVNASIPLILYTATYSSPDDRELAEAVGADSYILKPAPVSVLLDAIKQAQEKGRDRRLPAQRIDESYVLERYNAVLVRKLEARNAELQHALNDLQAAHAQILELNRSLETRVAQRTADLDAANRELEAFSYSVAHDLRSPLARISGFAELLERSSAKSLREEARGYLASIRVGARLMDRLIEDLLEFSRLGRVELSLSEVDLEGVLDEALEIVQFQVEGRNIQWNRTRLPRAHGDAALLRQVFVNLISNAVKYTGTRNPAVIEIGGDPTPPDEMVVFIRDNGVGFDMKEAGELFRAFKRLPGSEAFDGTGIGLAIAHRIVSRHGGRIWADAAADRGATFSFSLRQRVEPGTDGSVDRKN